MIYTIIQRRQSRTSRNCEAGQALALAAVSLTVLLLAAGLAIDMGFLRYQRRRIQSAADSAAIAGAGEVNYGDIQTAAQDDAALNGFTDGGSGNTQVNVECSASETGGFGADCGTGTPYVQVSVSQQEPLFFMKIIPGITQPTISAQAVGFFGNGQSCIYALGGGNGIRGSSGGASTTVNTECGIISNGPINIGQCLNNFSATSIGYGYETSATVSGCAPAPTPQMIPTTAPNPLANVTGPGAPGGCTPAGMTIYGSPAGSPIVYPPLAPGSYPCGIQINGNAILTFNPGTYVLGGGLTIQGPRNTITGNGVTFYNSGGSISICASGTGTIYTYPGSPCGAGDPTETITLTAPTSGSYAGILFFQASSDLSPATILGNDAYGSGNTFMEGIFYFPSAPLTLAESTNGSAWESTYNAIVATSISLIGTVQFGDGSGYLPSLANGSPIKDAVLVQ